MSCTLPYPRDVLRYDYFTRGSSQHQAKMELRTFMWCVDKYTKVGDVILDPMAGTGTVHLAEFMGRHTISIETVPEFHALIESNWRHLIALMLEKETEMLRPFEGIITDTTMHRPKYLRVYPTMLKGDSRRLLPLEHPVDAIIFSPPYGNLWAKQKNPSKAAREKNYREGYNDSIANIGNAKNFMSYLFAMQRIYKGCYDSLKTDGVIVSVVKDYISKGERVLCSKDNLSMMMDAGFTPGDWHYRDASQTSSPFSVGLRKKRIEAGTHREELEINKEDILVAYKRS